MKSLSFRKNPTKISVVKIKKSNRPDARWSKNEHVSQEMLFEDVYKHFSFMFYILRRRGC